MVASGPGSGSRARLSLAGRPHVAAASIRFHLSAVFLVFFLLVVFLGLFALAAEQFQPAVGRYCRAVAADLRGAWRTQ